MNFISLFPVLLIAKTAMLWGHASPISAWSVLAYTYQDATVALGFAAFALALERIGAPNWIARGVYWITVIYIAINIPVGRAVATPLTWPMLRAARGPLADSMRVYVTSTNVVLVAAVIAAAAWLPMLIGRIRRTWFLFILPFALLGPMANHRVDTHGMDRNAITALITDRLPRVVGAARPRDWRESQFHSVGCAEDLSRFSGIARDRNIVMVGLESTAAQYLSIYGSRIDVMPNLSALATHAIVFDNAYAVYPESIKGLFSVLRSRFPAFDSRPEDYESVESPAVAAVLADAGYRTAMFHSGRFEYLGMESIVRRAGYQTLEDAGDIGGNRNSSFGVDEPATVHRMLEWIDALPRGQHFFLTYLPIAGHHPYATPERGPFEGTEEIDQYRNALHYGDESLGALIRGLRDRGLEPNTVWVIYGDHGEAFHQHEGNYGHTFFLYEENVHVPFIIASEQIRAEVRVNKVVSLVDTAPTILDLAGVPSAASFQGRTMLDGSKRTALFFADYSLGLLGLRDGPWKFVYEIGAGRQSLFDLSSDPRERSDVSASQAVRAAAYRATVRGWSSEQRGFLMSRNPGR